MIGVIYMYIWVFPKIVKIMENPIKMDDLGVPLFLETAIYIYTATWVMVYYRSHPLQEPEKSIHLDGILKKKQHSGFFNT